MKKAKKMYYLGVAGILMAATALTTGIAFADTGITQVDNLFTWFTSFFTNIKDNLTGVLAALAVVVMLVMLGMWMVTTNDKKTDVYKKKFFTVLVIVGCIAAMSGIVALATAIGTSLNTKIGS